jgi:hypothetical protein
MNRYFTVRSGRGPASAAQRRDQRPSRCWSRWRPPVRRALPAVRRRGWRRGGPASNGAAGGAPDCAPQPDRRTAPPRNPPFAPGPSRHRCAGAAPRRPVPLGGHGAPPERTRRGGASGSGPPTRGRGQAVSFSRPLARRALTIARPARVRIRSRNPCVFARRRLFGWKVRLVTTDSADLSGPARTWRTGRRASGRPTVRKPAVQGQTEVWRRSVTP